MIGPASPTASRTSAQPVQVPGDVGVADLDLEAAVALGLRLREQRDVGLVGEMEVEAAGVEPDLGIAAAEQTPQRQAQPPCRAGPTAPG